MYSRRTNVETEFNVLMTLMANMIAAQATQPASAAPSWCFSLHDLSLKLFRHLCSVRALLEPCGFHTATLHQYSYIDHSSVAVVTRTSIENYLVMHWLFSGGDESLREFRHTVWEYCGWKKRSKLIATIESAKLAKQAAADAAAKLLTLIEASPYFRSYNDSQRKSLRKGKWDVDWHWNDLAKEAELHQTYFTSIYPYLSGYVHSDFISSLQVGQANSIGVQYELGISSIQISLVLIGHFSYFYANLFPAAKAVFDASGDAKELASKWYLRAGDMDFLYSSDSTGNFTPD